MARPPTSGTGGIPRGISLSNSLHSEVAPCLPLPSLPVFCGALDQELRLFDELHSAASRSVNRIDVVSQAGKIAQLLSNTDVSYLWVLFFLFQIWLILSEFELICLDDSLLSVKFKFTESSVRLETWWIVEHICHGCNYSLLHHCLHGKLKWNVKFWFCWQC